MQLKILIKSKQLHTCGIVNIDQCHFSVCQEFSGFDGNVRTVGKKRSPIWWKFEVWSHILQLIPVGVKLDVYLKVTLMR